VAVTDPGADEEIVDAVPVLDTPVPHPDDAGAPVVPTSRATLTVSAPRVRQAAAVAVTGFAAGAATLAVVHARRARTPKRRGRGKRGGKAVGEVVATRSFLVDVHLLGGRG
jgi:hypothetical protein